MIPIISKRRLGILAKKLGEGKTGIVYPTNFNLAQSNGPLLYKEYKPQFLKTIDINVLRDMVSYISSLQQAEAKQFLLNCSWPLALVGNEQDEVIGILFECADECFRTSNYIKKRKDFKGTSELFCPDKNYEQRTGCQPLLYEEKELLIYRFASILADLHKRQIVVGDISPMNILVAVFPDYRVFLIDADSMSIRGRSILSDVRTPNWAVKDKHSQESESSYASDCYKLALFALRILKQEQDIRLPENLPQNVDPGLASLIIKTLSDDASTRPPISEWIKVLQGRAKVGRVARSFLSHGQSQARQGNRTKANAAYDNAIVLDNSLADAYLARSEIRISLGDLDGGMDDYNYVVQLQPQQEASLRVRLSQSIYEYGKEEFRKGNKANALAAYGKAIETNPDSADPLLARAELRMEQRDLNGAIDDYNAIIRLKPDQRDLYNNRLADALLARAELRTQQRDLIGAIDDYNALIRLRPGQKDLYNNRGYCKWENEDYRGAYDDFDLEITNNASAEAFFNRAEAKRHFGDNRGAIADINQGLALNPQKLTPSLKEFYENNKFLGSKSVSRWIETIADQMRENWKLNNQRRNNRTMAGNSPVVQLLPFKTSKIWLVIALFCAVFIPCCAAVIQYDRHLALTKEQSLVTQLKKLRDSGDYESCVRKESDIRSQIRDALRFESAQIKAECLSGQHNNLFNKTNSMSGSSRNVESFRQLHEELRTIANEAYTNAQLLGKIQQTQELLKTRMKEYADQLYQQTARINDVVQLYQLAGDYDNARSLRNAWKEDESLLKSSLSKLERLDPSAHNPFEWPRFRTSYWKGQFDQQYPQIIAERAVNAAKYYMERTMWGECVQVAEKATIAAKQIGDSNLEAKSEYYRKECIIGARAPGGREQSSRAGESDFEAALSIRVTTATYGGNCGASQGNATQDLRTRCNGQPSCRYLVDHRAIGDPAYGCGKTYEFTYTCGSTQRQGLVQAEASGRYADLSCQ